MASISALSAGPGLSGLRGRVAPTGWAPEGSGRHQGRSGRGREGPRVASERRARGSPQGEGTKGPRPTPKDKARAPCPVLLRDPGWRALGSVLAVGWPGQHRDQADTRKAQTLSEPQGPLSPTRGARPHGIDRDRRHTAAFALRVGTRPVGRERTRQKLLLTCHCLCDQPVCDTKRGGFCSGGPGLASGPPVEASPSGRAHPNHVSVRVTAGSPSCRWGPEAPGGLGDGVGRGRGIDTHLVRVQRPPDSEPVTGRALRGHRTPRSHTQVTLIPAWPQVSTLPMKGRLTWSSAAEKEEDKPQRHRRQEHWHFPRIYFISA